MYDAYDPQFGQQQIAQNFSGHEVQADRCLELLDEIASENLSPLRGYAAYRLQRVGLNGQAAEDVLHDAIAAVLSGIHNKNRGRHPLDEDLQSVAAFVRYLRGVINSLVEAERRRRENSHGHENIDAHCQDENGSPGVALITPVNPENDTAWRDLNEQLFARLREIAPKHLQPMISMWQLESLWAEKIPLGDNWRRHRAELREVAKKIFHGLENSPAERNLPGQR